jgi:hypothetical protein
VLVAINNDIHDFKCNINVIPKMNKPFTNQQNPRFESFEDNLKISIDKITERRHVDCQT